MCFQVLLSRFAFNFHSNKKQKKKQNQRNNKHVKTRLYNVAMYLLPLDIE